MLKKLLKYELKATSRTMGGLYLALLAVAALLGLMATPAGGSAESFLGDLGTRYRSAAALAMGFLGLLYSVLLIALVVLTFVSILRRFNQNLLGGEGYLMHTLPVSTRQLLGSKLIASLLWVAASILVSLASLLLLILIIGLRFSSITELSTAIQELFRALAQLFELDSLSYMLGTLLTAVTGLACAILCAYAACMLGHQFPRHPVLAGILAYFAMEFVQSHLHSLLRGYTMNSYALSGLFSATVQSSVIVSTAAAQYFWQAVLVEAAFSLVFAALYFCLTDWLLRTRLNLE